MVQIKKLIKACRRRGKNKVALVETQVRPRVCPDEGFESLLGLNIQRVPQMHSEFRTLLTNS